MCRSASYSLTTSECRLSDMDRQGITRRIVLPLMVLYCYVPLLRDMFIKIVLRKPIRYGFKCPEL